MSAYERIQAARQAVLDYLQGNADFADVEAAAPHLQGAQAELDAIKQQPFYEKDPVIEALQSKISGSESDRVDARGEQVIRRLGLADDHLPGEAALAACEASGQVMAAVGTAASLASPATGGASGLAAGVIGSARDLACGEDLTLGDAAGIASSVIGLGGAAAAAKIIGTGGALIQSGVSFSGGNTTLIEGYNKPPSPTPAAPSSGAAVER